VSAAANEIVTELMYGELEHPAPLQAIAVVGATVSGGAWITWVPVASALPA